MVISHNILAMNASRQFNMVENAKKKSTEKLSSGYRINRAADDAAGLAISEKMRKQIRGLDKGASNIQEGISLVQVADGALAEVTGMLQRMNVLSVQAANGTNSQSDRRSIQAEIDQLNKEIDRIGETTSFNGTYIFKDLDGETKNREHEVIDLMSCPEAFEFELVNGPSSATDLSGKVTHKYKIGIGNCTSAEDIVDTVYDYVRNNLPDTVPQNPASGGPIGVSHSNMMTKSPDGRSLIIYATSKAKPTPEEAANVYQTGPYGRVTSSYVTMEGDKGEAKNYLKIQCSGVDFDQEMIYTRVINSDMLGTDGINLLAEYGP